MSARRQLARWTAFNAVGVLGFVVQLATLGLLKEALGLDYLVATGLAVEVSVLHNFLWHERWTWADRTALATGGALDRLARFHGATAAVSITGNLLLTWLFVDSLGLHYLVANTLAVGGCSIVNFLLSDALVFRPCRRQAISPDLEARARSAPTETRRNVAVSEPRTSSPQARCAAASPKLQATIIPLLLVALVAPAGAVEKRPAAGETAELRDHTIAAWDAYIAATERRIEAELGAGGSPFLVLDFQPRPRPVADRERLLAGEVLVADMETVDGSGDAIEVPDGMIHHWRGAVFIPGVDVGQVLARVADPDESDTRQQDVLESEVLERGPGFLRIYLKLQREKFVTVTYNTEHLVRYRWHGARRASSRSTATRIAELADAGSPNERERPVGDDRGFLWRLNSYWRYEAVEGGVIVECESVSLSRSVPAILRFVVGPLIRSTARGSMDRTLSAMRERYVRLAAR